jgi:hypothetical protein
MSASDMKILSSASCTALVPFERRPRLIFSSGNAGEISRFDPYALLCVPSESLAEVSALSRASSSMIRNRTARIRSAYLELAARFHPDTYRSTSTHSSQASNQETTARTKQTNSQWISDADCFAHIATSYRLLLDLERTVQYHLAASAPSRGETLSTDSEDLHVSKPRIIRAYCRPRAQSYGVCCDPCRTEPRD